MADKPTYARISEVAETMASMENARHDRTNPDSTEDVFEPNDFWPQAKLLCSYNDAHVDYVLEQMRQTHDHR